MAENMPSCNASGLTQKTMLGLLQIQKKQRIVKWIPNEEDPAPIRLSQNKQYI
jgi:hypothetical protein